jgi:hypothetical protein
MQKLDEAIQRALGKAEPNPRTKWQPTSFAKVEVACRYISEQVKNGGPPSRGAIRGAVQRAFGPQVKFSEAELVKARACAMNPAPSELEILQAEVASLKKQLAEVQLALTIQTGPTILSLIDEGCVIHIEPAAPRR